MSVKIEIGTTNKKYDDSRNTVLELTKYEDIGFALSFFINPSSVNIQPTTITQMEKVAGGYQKVGFGTGLISLAFSGTIPLYNKNNRNNKTYSGDIRTTRGYRWFAELSDFVLQNSDYPFFLIYHSYATELAFNFPVLKGDITPPSYSQSAEDPWKLDYSFDFQGILMPNINARNYNKVYSIEKIIEREGEKWKALDLLDLS